MIGWEFTGGWFADGTDIVAEGQGSAVVPKATLRQGSEVRLNLTLEGEMEQGGVVRIRIGVKQLAVSSVGFKSFRVAMSYPGQGFQISSRQFSGRITGLTGIGILGAVVAPNDKTTTSDAQLFVTGGPDLSSGLSRWYNRKPTEALGDAERRWLSEQGVAYGPASDMWGAFLRGLGYAGSVDTMKLQYWNGRQL